MMDRMAEVLDRVANTSSRNRKVNALATWLRELDDEDLGRATLFLAGGRKLSIGGSLLREAALAVANIDLELFRVCHRAVGDTSETISLLLYGKTKEEPLSLAEAEVIYTRLASSRKSAEKVNELRAALARMKPLTVKYFLKVITGNFRIGLQAKMVEEAVAQANGVSLAAVRDANNRTGDLAKVALVARHGDLATLEARLFHPMEFMLARPLDEIHDLPEPTSWYVEDKYDGIRSQVHFEQGRVHIFTRGLEDTTAAFPEIALAFAHLGGSGIVDGELLAWRNGRALNFTVMQQRIARKKVTEAMLAEIPVWFIGYDLIYRDRELLLDQPIEVRRRKLEDLLTGLPAPLMLSPQRRLRSLEDVEQSFLKARADGNEGLLLKREGSLYEAAKRSANWYKVKRPYATLDVVVTAAEQGNGRRATMLSDYTFAVRDGDRYLNVGKAYSGLTDEEIRELTKLFRSIVKERFSRVLLVEPRVILEVAFDGIQKSPRHKSGYALRFPRILRWRQDKPLAEIDTLERVKELYERSLTG
ncbi:cisplatin damage response ATP-dependent DNA ligase [Bryobacter aggregatus]|uniref:cisplatin damage response ATP-dependent DNA ligase n=1 Tax=Bryobacter aggregatus TaxID=360054 RepID=UPI000689AD5A|nr:cisplatin damage response ATP-dependent DNA ligase [Bryobacter aggregatus]